MINMLKNRWVVGIMFLVVAVIAFFGWLWATNFFAPPEITVFVALEDIDPGDVLTPDKVTTVLIRMENPDAYIINDEIETYGFNTVIQRIGVGELIPKAAISMEGNPASENRVSLGLADPGFAAMVIPVNPDVSPERIVVGDRVRITGSFGAATFLTGQLEAVPTPLPFDNTQLYFGNLPGANDAGNLVGPLPTPTPQDVTNLPVAKTLVFDARVLQVVYEKEFNPSASSETTSGTYINGDIRSLVVSVPIDMVEPLTFLANNSFITIAVLDPSADDMTGEISPGISWNDFAAFFEAQRVLWAATPQPEDDVLLPGGADIVAPTVIAPFLPVETEE